MAKVLILGDLFPRNIMEIPKLPDNDFCLANLECAITNSEAGIEKDGPNLKVNEVEVDIITKLGVNLVGLANNHVLDYGIDGLKDTLSYLDSKGIKHSGTSLDSNYCISNIHNKKIGFYFVSEHQFNYVKEVVEVNLLDQSKTFDEIKKLKSMVDFVLVIFHGGREYYEHPTPNQQFYCHKFIDSGADLVVCQHSHCVGSRESYKNAEIIYGQGNFMFPYRNNDDFKSGLIIELDLDNNFALNFYPVVHVEQGVVRMANDSETKAILARFEKNSKMLEKNTVEQLYDELIKKYGLDILYRLFNKSKFYIRLDTSRFFKNRMLKRYIRKNKKYILYLYNYFNCETHVEFIKSVLERQINDKK